MKILQQTDIENTHALQKRHPDVYKDFFSNADLVVSADLAYDLLPALSWMDGGMALYHKVPFKAYISITANQAKNRVIFGKVLSYIPHHDTFEQTDEVLNAWKDGLTYLSQELVRLYGQNVFRGITVNFLLEQANNTGLEASLGTLLAAAATLWTGVVSPLEFEQFSQLTSRTLWDHRHKDGDAYRRLHALSMKLLRRLSHGRMVSGATVLKTVIASTTPMVYWTQTRGGSEEDTEPGRFPLEIGTRLDLFDKMRWWGARLDELEKVSGPFPLDALAIFPGTSGADNFDILETRGNDILQNVAKTQDQAAGWMASFVTEPTETGTPAFMDTKTRGSYWHAFAAGQSVSIVAFVQHLINAYKQRASSQELETLLDAINATEHLNDPFVERVSSNIQELERAIFVFAKATGLSVAVRKLSVSSNDRYLMVFGEKGKLREKVSMMMDAIRAYSPNARLVFASWRDGWGQDGVKVEQFVSQGAYSAFVNQHAVRQTVWDTRGRQVKKIVTNSDVDAHAFDLLLNRINGKISIGGKGCTSKELLSQKATIEILRVLLTNDDFTAKNDQFPASSYAKYRNEFQGKISAPLSALVRQRTGKDISFVIEGGLTAFTVRLHSGGTSVCLLEPIQA